MVRSPLTSRISCAAAGLVLVLGTGRLAAQDAQDTDAQIAKIGAQLLVDGDRAKLDQLRELANFRTRPAFDALSKAYEAFQSIFMKREVVRVLPTFDGVGEAEQAALQLMMDVATSSPEPELREAALDGLGSCQTHGKDFLRLIVNSPAEDSVREKAMKAHVALSNESDHAWYREIYKPKADDSGKDKEKAKPKPKPHAGKPKKGGKDDDEDENKPKRVVALNTIRLMAFEAIAPKLTIDELTEAASKDHYSFLRKLALEQLEQRGDKKTIDLAHDILKNPGEHPENRVVAAKIVARIEGVKAAPEFIKRAISVDSPVELRRGLAEILAAYNDPTVNRDLLQELGKGNAHEKLFQMYAVRSLQDERVDKALLRMLSDKETEVIIGAAKILGERKAKDAAVPLQKLFEKTKEKAIQRAALDALAQVREGDATWADELVKLTQSDDPEVRNLAIQQLGATAGSAHMEDLVKSLEDPNWSVRLAALGALERLRTREAVSAIIARMPKEEGRMLDEFASALWRLTGQSFQTQAAAWAAWWADKGATFKILSDVDLATAKRGNEEWRLRQTTRVASKFFGIRIVSHRVIFIIDVSGSMDEGLANDYQGKSGQKKIEVAKNELKLGIESIDPTAMFNIIPFSSGVEHWVDGLAAANEKNRADALTFVGKLAAFGGTNLYGAVRQAFMDKDVDTIFIMSDGEPTDGEVTDPLLIRETVASWNENRHIVINTVAVGGQFQILEWLAADSGGTHVKFE